MRRRASPSATIALRPLNEALAMAPGGRVGRQSARDSRVQSVMDGSVGLRVLSLPLF